MHLPDIPVEKLYIPAMRCTQTEETRARSVAVVVHEIF